MRTSLPLILALLVPLLAAQEWDHQAHSKPGGPYYVVDWDGDGEETVTLDASESHSHYFNFGPPPKSGVIVSYHWESGATGKTIIKTKSPYITGTFYFGITILKLSVTDNMGDVATGWTYIQVRKPHSHETKKPTIESIEPQSGPPTGGISVTIEGSGFYNNPKVYFAGVLVESRVVDDDEIVAITPKFTGVGEAPITVTTGYGSANAPKPFSVQNMKQPPVSFEVKTLQARQDDGDTEDLEIPEITCIKAGPDGRYYAGSLDGFLYKMALSRDLVAEQWCKSKQVGKQRSILGLAFHPHEWSTPRAYISTSALFWKTRGGGTWHNGDVEVWTSIASAECMSFSHTLVTGLPVSNHDHGVNALEFTNNGDLLISIGGTTNAGLSTHGDKVGGIPESPFSGAVLRAKLSLGVKFDGKIAYDQTDNPHTANVVSGSVDVYSAGLRNVFGMTRHSNGKVYAVDNGPNPAYGAESVDCSTAGAQVGFQDSLLLLTDGAYYGHPNRNRARKDKRQCTYAKGDKKLAGYTAPLAVVPSATTAILEYTANTFGGQLRGDLLLGKLSWTGPGELRRAQLSPNGAAVVGDTEPFLKESGLSMVMGPFGEILSPKLKQKKIIAYVPNDHTHEALRVISVNPRRGPAEGVNPVLISGDGFWEGVKIFFGGKECLTYKARTRESVWCQVPPGKPGSSVVVVAKRDGLSSKPSTLADYEYMLY